MKICGRRPIGRERGGGIAQHGRSLIPTTAWFLLCSSCFCANYPWNSCTNHTLCNITSAITHVVDWTLRSFTENSSMLPVFYSIWLLIITFWRKKLHFIRCCLILFNKVQTEMQTLVRYEPQSDELDASSSILHSIMWKHDVIHKTSST